MRLTFTLTQFPDSLDSHKRDGSVAQGLWLEQQVREQGTRKFTTAAYSRIRGLEIFAVTQFPDSLNSHKRGCSAAQGLWLE
jgi:hypothetical protein